MATKGAFTIFEATFSFCLCFWVVPEGDFRASCRNRADIDPVDGRLQIRCYLSELGIL
jgi:hypothetical protein